MWYMWWRRLSLAVWVPAGPELVALPLALMAERWRALVVRENR
jgi:hypothetical protein